MGYGCCFLVSLPLDCIYVHSGSKKQRSADSGTFFQYNLVQAARMHGKVKYPFLQSHPQYELAKKQMKAGGGIVTFIVKGGLERGRKFLNAAEMLSHTANLGDSRTIITHSVSTTHSKISEEEREKVGILSGLIHISTGLEHIDDIIYEVGQALEKSK